MQIEMRVTGPKCSGQNGIRTKWYGQNGIRTKWYGQDGTERMVLDKMVGYTDKILLDKMV